MSRIVQIGKLSEEVERMLDFYADEVADGTDEAAKKAAQQCVKDIRANASRLLRVHHQKTYAKQWAMTQTAKGRGKAGYTVYCKKPGLPHLVENGHAKVTGGRVSGIPHISQAAEKAAQSFQVSVEEVLSRAKSRD